MDEPKYTAEEWRQMTAKRQCSAFGHDWEIMNSYDGPLSVYCDRNCGHPGYTCVDRSEIAN